jgi:predicted phage gp36 major capsid-like protein
MTDDELKALFAEQRRHAETLHEDVRQRFDMVAETITHLDQKIDRTSAELRTEIRRESEETRALLRLSYTELERRLSTLEERVDRLETLIRPPQA